MHHGKLKMCQSIIGLEAEGLFISLDGFPKAAKVAMATSGAEIRLSVVGIFQYRRFKITKGFLIVFGQK